MNPVNVGQTVLDSKAAWKLQAYRRRVRACRSLAGLPGQTAREDTLCTMQHNCAFVWGAIAATLAFFSAFVLFIVFGVLLLVPAGPYEHRQIALGSILCALGGTGIASLAAFVVFFPIGAGLGALCDCCVDV